MANPIIAKHIKGLSRWEQMMVEYGFYHQKLINLITHFIGVPIIVASVLVPLTWLPFAQFNIGGLPIYINAAWILGLATAVFYYSLDKSLGLVSLIMILILIQVASHVGLMGIKTSGLIALAGFVGGFVLQFIGHGLENKKPALVDNPLIAFATAPLFVIAEIAVKLGFKKELIKKVNGVIANIEAESAAQ